MKKSFQLSTLLALTFLAGCTQGTPGGPGTLAEKPTIGQAEDTFNLSVPMLATSIQQGDTLEAKIGIERATNFNEDVTLVFTDLPVGVTIAPATPMIKHGDTDAKIVFQVADGATLGDSQLKVTGHPAKGTDATVEFKLSIVAKDSFALAMPIFSISLKQGETKDVPIGIKRDKRFDKEVSLVFGELPQGVTIKSPTPVIKPGESEALVTISSTPDASLGQFTIPLTGHPTEGVDVTNQLPITIAKAE